MMFRKRLFLFLVFFALLWLILPGAEASDLPLDHWAYDYLDRMKVKGVLDGFMNQTRPLPRLEVAQAVYQVIRAAKTDDSSITPVERSQLEWLQMEFATEFRVLDIAAGKKDRHLLSLAKEDAKLVLDLLGQIKGSLGCANSTDRHILDTRVTVQARGFLGRQLSYDACVAKGQVNTNLDHVTREDVGLTGYFNSCNDRAYYDWSHGHLSLRFPWVELQLGRQPLDWGPGVRGNLSLSRHPPAYDFLQFRAKISRIKFVHVHGFLISDVMTEYQTADGLFVRREYPNKFVAAHRLEIGLLNWLDLGLTETIIYGERDLDFAYLNPLVLFWSAQHSSHDRDNETMGADIRIRPFPGLSLYGALFIDEIYLKELLASDARNKGAFQGGIYIVDPLGIADTDLRVEYVRVQPCVYTHKFPVNTYCHDGFTLGHWLGQNGDDLFLELRHRFSRCLRFDVQLEKTRHGQKGEMPYCHDEPARYSFLQGIVDRTMAFSFILCYEPIKDLCASLSYKRIKRRNKDHIAGEDENLNEISLALSFDY